MKHGKKWIALAMAVAMILSPISESGVAKAAGKTKLSTKEVTLEKGDTFKLKLKKNKKKVKWSVNKKKIVSLTVKNKNTVLLTAKKKGKAKVTAKVGKKKYTCSVVVTDKEKTEDEKQKPTQTPPLMTVAPSATAPVVNVPASNVPVTTAPVESSSPEVSPTPKPTNNATATVSPSASADVQVTITPTSNVPVTIAPVESSSPEVSATPKPTNNAIATVSPSASANVQVTIAPTTTPEVEKSLITDVYCSHEYVQGVSIYCDESVNLIEVFGSFTDIRTVRDSIEFTYIENNVEIVSEVYSSEAYFSDTIPGYYQIQVKGILNGEEVTETYFMIRTGEFSYTEAEDNTLQITRYKGKAEFLSIPAKLEAKKVTEIGSGYLMSGIFEECDEITRVIIPNGVIEINSYAFWGCSNLSQISIPNTVKKVDYIAFVSTKWWNVQMAENTLVIINNILLYGTNAQGEIVVPEGVTTIANFAFTKCASLTAITLPNGLEHIGDNAFESCISLKEIVLPDSIQSIGSKAFYLCTQLKSIVLSNTISSIGYRAFYGTIWMNEQKKNATYGLVIINNILIDVDVNAIGNNICVPADVYHIASGAFQGMGYKIASITLSDGLQSIGDSAFLEWFSLGEIRIPESVDSIGQNAFPTNKAFILKVKENSYAHTYAIDNDINYSIIS